MTYMQRPGHLGIFHICSYLKVYMTSGLVSERMGSKIRTVEESIPPSPQLLVPVLPVPVIGLLNVIGKCKSRERNGWLLLQSPPMGSSPDSGHKSESVVYNDFESKTGCVPGSL